MTAGAGTIGPGPGAPGRPAAEDEGATGLLAGTGIRVGVDLADVDAVAASVARFGPRYTGRLFTEAELADSAGSPANQARSLAARFAAKEAAIKVLEVTAEVPGWKEIEIRRSPSGACRLHLSGTAKMLADRAGLHSWAVSLSHESRLAAAVVVASAAPAPDPL